MAKQLIKPGIDRLFKNYVTGLVKDLSKKSVFIAVNFGQHAQCPNCIFDAVGNAGTGRYNGTGSQPFDGKVCPTCKNSGYVTPEAKQKIEAIVQWGRFDSAHPDTPEAGGIIPQGHARIKVEVRYYDTIANAEYYLVDGIRCSKVRQPIKRGLQSYVIAELLVKRDD